MPESWLSDELFDRVPVAICVIDRGFQVVEANARFTELYGEWIGHRCFEVYKDRKDRCVRCGAAKTFEDGKTRAREEEGVDRHGRPTHYLVDIVPVVRDDGSIPYIIEMSTDITQVKQLEREKREAERLFKKILTYCNHVGLLSEDIEFDSKRLLGNFPQGYSHLALIDTAITLSGEDITDEL